MSAPDERAFQAAVAKADFRLGQVDRRWRLDSVAWPHAHIAVTAKDGREFLLRFNVAGYPQTPPTACLWDLARSAILPQDQWPKSGGGRVAAVFNFGWKQGTALYLPCDREAIPGHDNWRTEMPSKIWRPAEGIVQYLELVHELLNSRDYRTVLVPAA